MSDDSTESGTAEEQDGPSIARTERMFLRLTMWQTVLSVVGVFIAVVALYAALKESAAVRQQTAAAVWPFVQFVMEEFSDGERAEFTISFANTGVGPARMRSMKLSINGTVANNWDQAIALAGGKISERERRNFISKRVLSPDERIDAFSTSDPTLVRSLTESVASSDTWISFCYCSIFDDCWLADSRRSLQDPSPVEHCPGFGADAFSD